MVANLMRGLAVGLVTVAGTLAAPAQAQRVQTFANGELLVTFDRSCSVYFDRTGALSSNSPGCSGAEIERAVEVVARRRPQGPGGSGADPLISYGRNGAAEVAYIGTSCLVFYGSGGVRERALPGCTPAQIRRADRAMSYGQTNLGPPFPGYAGAPDVSLDDDGSGRVFFAPSCTIRYDRRGRRFSTHRSCTSEQRAIAREEMARYRAEQGLNN